jgi:hypothetical protein
MAEEGYLGVARALDSDEDYTKAELQRRMEEARESISQTVTEIKDTVATQYQSYKEALDWREQYRKHPVAWTAGALGVGAIVGYSLGGAIVGDRDDDYYSDADDDVATSQSSYAFDLSTGKEAVAGGAYGSSEYAEPTGKAQPAFAPVMSDSSSTRPSYSSGYQEAPTEAEDADKPGLISRFKETRAYDRLQEEVADLGNRFMDELSNAARTIVLPALFNKIKEMVGVDLSRKQLPEDKGPRGGGGLAAGSTGSRREAATDNTRAAAASASGSSASSVATPSSPRASKFDRLADESTLPKAQSGEAGTGFGYDDRYERESQLYARSENRAFNPQTKPENKGGTADPAGSNRSDAPPQSGRS